MAQVPVSGIALSFLHLPVDSQGRDRFSLGIGFPVPMNLLVYQTKCITCGWMLSQKGWTARTFTPSKWLPLKPDGHMYSYKCYSTASDEWQSA